LFLLAAAVIAGTAVLGKSLLVTPRSPLVIEGIFDKEFTAELTLAA
jgi:hypothetical protein